MRRDWRRVASDAIRRNDHRNALAGAVAGIGAAVAIGVMERFSLNHSDGGTQTALFKQKPSRSG